MNMGESVVSSFPNRNRPPSHSEGRHGVRREQEASSTPTYVTASRGGCRLRVPARCLEPRAGTMTLEEYRAWEAKTIAFYRGR